MQQAMVSFFEYSFKPLLRCLAVAAWFVIDASTLVAASLLTAASLITALPLVIVLYLVIALFLLSRRPLLLFLFLSSFCLRPHLLCNVFCDSYRFS
jgi:hypothetical protein